AQPALALAHPEGQRGILIDHRVVPEAGVTAFALLDGGRVHRQAVTVGVRFGHAEQDGAVAGHGGPYATDIDRDLVLLLHRVALLVPGGALHVDVEHLGARRHRFAVGAVADEGGSSDPRLGAT